MSALTDRTILITRTRQQGSELAARLEALGATTVHIPTIEIVAPESFAGLDGVIAELDEFAWVIFTSANAVTAFAQRRELQPGAPQPRRVAVIGPATARAAGERGLGVDLVPEKAIAESLVEALIPQLRRGQRVVLVRAAAARDVLPEAMAAAGVEVTIAEAYRTVVPGDSVEAVCGLFSAGVGYPDAVTFTSSSTATNLMALLEAAGVGLPDGMMRASIGPVTSATLRGLGISPMVEAREATVGSLVEAVVGYFQNQKQATARAKYRGSSLRSE